MMRKVAIRAGGDPTYQCRRLDSNQRPRAYESLALPLSYVGGARHCMSEAGGINPADLSG